MRSLIPRHRDHPGVRSRRGLRVVIMCESGVSEAQDVVVPVIGIDRRARVTRAIAIGASFAALESGAMLAEPGLGMRPTLLCGGRCPNGLPDGAGAAWVAHHEVGGLNGASCG
ncbi:hypothetical protein GCM10009733_021410 [Nonomuraea maheshkhaliensis]|uniref:Uncharacterized protein n=1 Tax=Nonomuraea maheshkhaliensis TaxID=419590 RepID=A0ABN2F015_9ACTN